MTIARGCTVSEATSAEWLALTMGCRQRDSSGTVHCESCFSAALLLQPHSVTVRLFSFRHVSFHGLSPSTDMAYHRRISSSSRLFLLFVFFAFAQYSHQDGEGGGLQAENAIQENVIAQPDSLFTFDDTILYKINWVDESLSASNKSSAESDDQLGGEEMIISSANNEQYRCVIPNVDKQVCFSFWVSAFRLWLNVIFCRLNLTRSHQKMQTSILMNW